MITNTLFRGLGNVPKVLRRNVGICAPVMQKASDPIQQLFLDKVREYKQKSSGGKLVEPSPDLEKELAGELEKVARQLGSSDPKTATEFPTFKFEEPKLENP